MTLTSLVKLLNLSTSTSFLTTKSPGVLLGTFSDGFDSPAFLRVLGSEVMLVESLLSRLGTLKLPFSVSPRSYFVRALVRTAENVFL